MKIVYAGFDLFAPCLEVLLEAGCRLMKVFTCQVDQEFEFNDRVIGIAESQGVPWTDKPIREEDLVRLKEEGCQLLFCAGYYHRIPVNGELPSVNLHPSLLPEGRGAWPMPVMILKGHGRGGVTLHKMTREFDQGEILLQREYEILPGDNLEDLTKRIHALIPGMVRELLRDFESLWQNARPQGIGSYWKCPESEDWTVHEDMSVDEAGRILRAFYGFECFYRGRGKLFRLVRGRVRPGGGSQGKKQDRNHDGSQDGNVCGFKCLPVCGGYVEAEIIEVIKKDET